METLSIGLARSSSQGSTKTWIRRPSGFEFKPIPLHHVLTLKGQAAMIHGGAVGSLPTSDGSVVVPSELAKALFGKIPVGCPVEIVAE